MTTDESNRRVEFDRIKLYTDFDIAVEVCDVVFAPVVTGPQIDVTGENATQSSTAAGAEGKRLFSVRFFSFVPQVLLLTLSCLQQLALLMGT